MRPPKGVLRLEVPLSTDQMIQGRVRPLLPRGVFTYINPAILDAVVRAAYIQGALDALTIATKHPDLLRRPA